MRLVVRSVTGSTSTIELKERTVIGREQDSDLILEDDPKLSRHHAVIERGDDGSFTLEDLGSTNGTFVGDDRLDSRLTLRGGERIRVGDTVLEVVGAAPPTVADRPIAEAPATVAAEPGTPTADASIAAFVEGSGEQTAPMAAAAGTLAEQPDSPRTILDGGAEPPGTAPDLGPPSGQEAADVPARPATVLDMGGEVGTVVDTPGGAGTVPDVGDRTDATTAPSPGRSRWGLIAAIIAGAAALVIAIVVIASSLGGDDEGPGSASPPTAPLSLAPPAGLFAQTRGWNADPASWKVTLMWDAPEGDVDHYEITRDSLSVRDAQALTSTTYTDTDVLPLQRYEYTIVAVSPSGATSEKSVAVRPVRLPTRLGRLQGEYELKFRVTETSDPDFYPIGYVFRAHWRFIPACRTGPCGGTGRDLQYPQIVLPIRMTAAGVFHGIDEGIWGNSCDEVDWTNERLTLDLRTQTASLVGKTWTATPLRGTLELYLPYFGLANGSYCDSDTFLFAVVARSE